MGRGKKPYSPYPKIEARQGPNGFELVDKMDSGLGVLFFAFFALFWNGISWGGFLLARNSHEKIPMFFIGGLFIPAGVFIIFLFVRQVILWRKLGSGKLTLPHFPLRVGDVLTVTYRRRVKGKAQVEEISGSFYCEEAASYTVGTDRHTARHIVWEHELETLTPASTFTGMDLEGSWKIAVPEEGPPSFSANNNEIQWKVTVKIKGEGFPADDSNFTLMVQAPKLA